MKKALIIVLTVAIAIASISVLAACDSSKIKFDSYTSAASYSAGERTLDSDGISKAEIDWVCGKIFLEESADGKISVTETSGELPDEQKVHTAVIDGVLKIKFWKSNLSATVDHSKKHLTVKLPKSVSVDIESVSADITADGITAPEIEIDITSGDVSLGNVTADKVEIDSTSGDLDIVLVSVSQAELNSTSGDFNITVELCPKCEIDSTSGNVNLIVAADPGATVKFSTVSGHSNIHSSKKGSATVGGGANSIKVDTTSGNLNVTEK